MTNNFGWKCFPWTQSFFQSYLRRAVCWRRCVGAGVVRVGVVRIQVLDQQVGLSGQVGGQRVDQSVEQEARDGGAHVLRIVHFWRRGKIGFKSFFYLFAEKKVSPTYESFQFLFKLLSFWKDFFVSKVLRSQSLRIIKNGFVKVWSWPRCRCGQETPLSWRWLSCVVGVDVGVVF